MNSLLIFALYACTPTSKITSKLVTEAKIEAINSKINTLYPKASDDLQQHILSVAVKSIENMVFIEGGSYMMGDFKMPCEMDNITLVKWSPDAKCASSINAIRYGTINLHKVTLSNYSLAKYETTYHEMNAYRLAHQLTIIDPEYNAKILQYPTPTKNWQQAKDYCTWLDELTGIPFDLPTEAQWEYAARDRGKYIYYATNDGEVRPGRIGSGYHVRLDDGSRFFVEWKKEEWNTYSGLSNIAVGSWPPNPLGIYDLAGNAAEWVNDWFSKDYYLHSPENNPQGPKTGEHKIQRGVGGERPVSTSRFIATYEGSYFSLNGFRCAVQQPTSIH